MITENERIFALHEVKLCIHEALDEREQRIMNRVGDIRNNLDQLEKRIIIWETRAQTTQYAARIFWGIVLGISAIVIQMFDLGKISIH
jgi:hypothetical protein